MKLTILRREGACYIKLPAEFSKYNELELFQLRDGYYLLSILLDSKQKAPDENEKALLEKLLAIRFQQRTPRKLDKMLSAEEKVTLTELIKHNFVNVFRSKKYPDGVYNIADNIYSLLQPSSKMHERRKEERPEGANQLKQEGFIVFEGNRSLPDAIKQQIKLGEVIAAKSFDGKIYVVTKKYFMKASRAIQSVLKRDMTVEEISRLCRIPADGCRAVLSILLEEGEVLERKRGVFAPA